MIRIKICDLAVQGACSYYRGIGAFSKLKYLDNNIITEYMTTVGWHTITDADVLLFVRPQEDNFVRSIEMAKDFGIPIWVDFDDYLHRIPVWNPAHEHYTTSGALRNIEKSMRLADVVTVTTPELKSAYQKFNSNIHIIPNAHNDYNYDFNFRQNPRQSIISWRGSTTHREDLLSVANMMWDTAEKNPSWRWHFIGNDLWYITMKIKNYINIKELDIISFYKHIQGIGQAIQIIPLLPNEFNSCKSNIGWQEGTFAGAAVIAPDLPEFQVPGCETYKTPDEFREKLQFLIDHPRARLEQYKQSYRYIKSNLLLSTVNKQRLDILYSLVKNHNKKGWFAK